MERVYHALGFACTIGMTGIMCYLFFRVLYGMPFYFAEQNPILLVLEILMSAFASAYQIVEFLEKLMKMRHEAILFAMVPEQVRKEIKEDSK